MPQSVISNRQVGGTVQKAGDRCTMPRALPGDMPHGWWAASLLHRCCKPAVAWSRKREDHVVSMRDGRESKSAASPFAGRWPRTSHAAADHLRFDRWRTASLVGSEDLPAGHAFQTCPRSVPLALSARHHGLDGLQQQQSHISRALQYLPTAPPNLSRTVCRTSRMAPLPTQPHPPNRGMYRQHAPSLACVRTPWARLGGTHYGLRAPLT